MYNLAKEFFEIETAYNVHYILVASDPTGIEATRFSDNRVLYKIPPAIGNGVDGKVGHIGYENN